MLLWVRWIGVFPLLALALATEPWPYKNYTFSKHYESPTLESLQCYNDYMSFVRCNWTETVHLQAPLSLHHLDLMDNSESPCIPFKDRVTLSDGRSTVHCQYNTTLFSVVMKSAFFFDTPCSSLLSRTFDLSQHVKVRPPANLSQELTKDGGVLLHWEVSYSLKSPLYHTLNYQVNYRHLNKTWEVAEISERKWKIESDFLVPGSWYEARVRARGGRSHWSEWSALVQWKTKDAELPGPANLLCVSDGELEVNCTWEVSRELAQFVTYRLSYRHQHLDPPQFCEDPLVSADPGDPKLRFSCSFTLISQHDELLVDLNSTYIVKIFRLIENIWLPCPDHVDIKEKQGDWVLSWSPLQTDIVPVAFEVRYWSTSTPRQECHYNVSQGDTLFVISAMHLQPSSLYEAQVRATIVPGPFKGKPSEWTDPVRWITHPGPRSITTIIYAAIGVCVVILSLILFCTLPMSYRRIRVWYLSIPSPLNSKVLTMKSPCLPLCCGCCSSLLSKLRQYELLHCSPEDKNPPSVWPVVQKVLDQVPISSIKVLDKSKLPQDCSKLTEEEPVLLTPTDENGLYQRITQQGWEVARDPGGQHWESQTKKIPSVGLTFPFSLCSSDLPLLEGLAVSQFCSEENVYQSTDCVLALVPCVPGYVEAPQSVTGRGQEATPEGRQELLAVLNADCSDYTPVPISTAL